MLIILHKINRKVKSMSIEISLLSLTCMLAMIFSKVTCNCNLLAILRSCIPRSPNECGIQENASHQAKHQRPHNSDVVPEIMQRNHTPPQPPRYQIHHPPNTKYPTQNTKYTIPQIQNTLLQNNPSYQIHQMLIHKAIFVANLSIIFCS